jgi:CubicO group peptidase (beta-lactamase class C family)
MREIAISLGLHHPVKRLEVASYMYARPLDFPPGAKSQYSNYCYLLAGAVVEKVTGMEYFEYVKKVLLDPAGITEVEVIPTGKSMKSARLTTAPARPPTRSRSSFICMPSGAMAHALLTSCGPAVHRERPRSPSPAATASIGRM